MNEPVPGSDIPFVGVDNFEGARIAADHLISQGHRRIAFIGHSTSRAVNQLRERGYRAALERAGITIEPKLVLDGDGTTESGRLATEHMFIATYCRRPFSASTTRRRWASSSHSTPAATTCHGSSR